MGSNETYLNTKNLGFDIPFKSSLFSEFELLERSVKLEKAIHVVNMVMTICPRRTRCIKTICVIGSRIDGSQITSTCCSDVVGC